MVSGGGISQLASSYPRHALCVREPPPVPQPQHAMPGLPPASSGVLLVAATVTVSDAILRRRSPSADVTRLCVKSRIAYSGDELCKEEPPSAAV